MGFCIVKNLNLSDITEIANKLGLTDNKVATFIRTLLSEGIITTNLKHEEPYVSVSSAIPSTYLELRSPVRITWLITNKCNLSCKHCYIRARPASKSDELPFAQIKDTLRKLAEAGVFTIYFTGGEPFARHDFMDILKEASDLGLKIGISTNGLFINEEIVRMLVEFNVFRTQISLDGATRKTHEFIRGTNTFGRTVTAIKRLVKGGIDVGITFVCHSGNIHELEDVIRLAAGFQAKGVKVSPLMPWGRAKVELNEYIPPFKFRGELKDSVLLACKRTGVSLLSELHIDIGMPEEHPFGCPLVMGMTLLPDARVIPCEVFGEKISPDVILGDLKEQTVEEVWLSPKAEWFRRAASVANKHICNECQHLQVCGSYCIAEIFLKYNTLRPPEEYFKECKTAWTQKQVFV